jgi:hypothetical protein
MIIDQFDALLEESERRSGGVMALSLHPFIVGLPFRRKYLDRALAHIRRHEDVWFTTSDAIADWYLEHGYADAVDCLSRTGKGAVR